MIYKDKSVIFCVQTNKILNKSNFEQKMMDKQIDFSEKSLFLATSVVIYKICRNLLSKEQLLKEN